MRGLDENQERIEERITYLEDLASADEQTLGDFDRDLLLERIGKLRGGLALIKPGGLN